MTVRLRRGSQELSLPVAEREDLILNFLKVCGWDPAARSPLAGDASPRRYERLASPRSDATAILMDAPLSECGSQQQFVFLTQFLRSHGLSAPMVYHADIEAGLLLLEDLGDDLLVRVARRGTEAELRSYEVAIDVLVFLSQQQPPQDIPRYTTSIQADLAALSLDWYCGSGCGLFVSTEQRREFTELMQGALDRLELASFIHRDFHAENLLWLPERRGLARIGILDFQNGALGCRAYDIVSLIEDARRDVGFNLRQHLVRRFARTAGIAVEDLEQQIAICGLQRNLRILGVFARLCLLHGKRHYANLILRVWTHIENDLAHLDVIELRDFIRRHIPRPDPEVLAFLRSEN